MVIVSVLACSEKEDEPPVTGEHVIISSDGYDTIPGDPLIISDLEITGDSLTFTISASGCDGSSWVTKLFASEGVLYSDPPQRQLKVYFDNPELCRAFISRTFSFNISALQIEDGPVYLNIVNAGEQVLYEY